jgi:hypothetical protein
MLFVGLGGGRMEIWILREDQCAFLVEGGEFLGPKYLQSRVECMCWRNGIDTIIFITVT